MNEQNEIDHDNWMDERIIEVPALTVGELSQEEKAVMRSIIGRELVKIKAKIETTEKELSFWKERQDIENSQFMISCKESDLNFFRNKQSMMVMDLDLLW